MLFDERTHPDSEGNVLVFDGLNVEADGGNGSHDL